jgi:large subunit ribosomal protein L24
MIMKKKFSKAWISSTQVRKQRKYRYNAPLHLRQRLVAAHLDKKLRQEYGRRSVQIRKGDEVIITVGQFNKVAGKVTQVNLKKAKIFVDNAKRKKSSGQEVQVPLSPSNVVITSLNLDDKKRKEVLMRKKTK